MGFLAARLRALIDQRGRCEHGGLHHMPEDPASELAVRHTIMLVYVVLVMIEDVLLCCFPSCARDFRPLLRSDDRQASPDRTVPMFLYTPVIIRSSAGGHLVSNPRIRLPARKGAWGCAKQGSGCGVLLEVAESGRRCAMETSKVCPNRVLSSQGGAKPGMDPELGERRFPVMPVCLFPCYPCVV